MAFETEGTRVAMEVDDLDDIYFSDEEDEEDCETESDTEEQRRARAGGRGGAGGRGAMGSFPDHSNTAQKPTNNHIGDQQQHQHLQHHLHNNNMNNMNNRKESDSMNLIKFPNEVEEGELVVGVGYRVIADEVEPPCVRIRLPLFPEEKSITGSPPKPRSLASIGYMERNQKIAEDFEVFGKKEYDEFEASNPTTEERRTSHKIRNTCFICMRVLHTTFSLGRHMKAYHDYPTLKIDPRLICDRCFYYVPTCERSLHRNECRPLLQIARDKLKQNSNQYWCKLCSKNFWTEKEFEIHFTDMHLSCLERMVKRIPDPKRLARLKNRSNPSLPSSSH